MARLFNYIPEFNGNISEWNTSNVENMFAMFFRSDFNGNISNWDISKVWNMADMFNKSKFNGDISNWDVSKVSDMSFIFYKSNFSKDLSNWRPYKLTGCLNMFVESQAEAPYWYSYTIPKERKEPIDFYHLQKKISQDYQDLNAELQVELDHKPNKKPKI